MAFPATYSGWVQYLRDWLGVDEYSDAQLGNFLDLAQTRLNKEMKSYWMEKVVSFTKTVGDPIALLTEVPDFSKVRLVSVEGIGSLDVAAINEIETKRQQNRDLGSPKEYCIDAGSLYIYPAVAEGGIISVFYYLKVPLIGGSTPLNSNVFTVNHPDALLYAASLEAAPYMIENENIPVWESKYAAALVEANEGSKAIKMGSTPLVRKAA